MNFNLERMATFGVAGNFTGHLEQAGEAIDFKNIKTKEEIAPKAIFPTYIPLKDKNSSIVPSYLTTFPFDTNKIIYPQNEKKIQLEPECAIIFNVTWTDSKITNIHPIAFGASNDCSIRKEGAKKISEKKNWGKSSKGLSAKLIAIDEFTSKGILHKYRIASFMIRENQIFTYGEDSAIRDYSYIYEKLIEWILEKLNEQKDQGPQENIHSYLIECQKPEQIMISIGATRYTEFGQTNFLQNQNESIVALYPEDKYNLEKLISIIKNNEVIPEDISILRQTVQL